MNYSKLKRLDELFAHEIEAGRLCDAAIYVEHKGKRVFENFYGTAKADSIFKIYSMTKPITSVATMILLERGIIDLEDDVKKYLPNVCAANQRVIEKNVATGEKSSRGNFLKAATKEIKIRNLLNMTSGMVYPNENEPFNETNDVQTEIKRALAAGENLGTVEIAEKLALAPLAFEAGEGWLYGTSADLLGALIEKATGRKFGDFLRCEIFEPLEMKDTDFYVPQEKIKRWMKPWSRKTDGHLEDVEPKVLEWMGQANPCEKVKFESGGGYLYSTLEDYSHFVHMLSNGGAYKGKQILGRKTIEYFGVNQLNERQMKSFWLADQGYGYANLMRVMLHPEMSGLGSVGEFGWDGLAGTYFFVDPKEELSLVYMQQIKEGGDPVLRRKFRNIVYSALL